MAKAYPILQSGFIAFDNSGFVRSAVKPSTFHSVILDTEGKDSTLDHLHYSPAVKELFTSWSSDPKLLKDFDFREKILKTAFIAFQSLNFYEWVELQNTNVALTSLHRTFMIETLEYFKLNSKRQTNLNTWLRLLERNPHPTGEAIEFKKYFKLSSDGNRNDSNNVPCSLSSVIKLWVSKEGGFEDLLLTLAVIFGERNMENITSTN